MVLHLTGALIAWFAPDDALTRWPALKAIVARVGADAAKLAAFLYRLLGGCRLFYAGQAEAKEVYGK
ncbi:hypothetical protein C5O80_33575 [Burkholderia sp. SRS-46]|nr:hypothetical protein C5O80_33575 [Burkholderia sp. SRS-46]